MFSGLVARFLSNALREDLLLVTVTAGVVYLPGAAGTVQEIFQAATPGYYSSDGGVPLVLLERPDDADAVLRVLPAPERAPAPVVTRRRP